jgi:hypothetical protein
VTTTYTTAPAPDGEHVVGAPVSHIPWVFCCCQGQRFCGWTRTANTWAAVPEAMTAKRRHELSCQGGLIPAG